MKKNRLFMATLLTIVALSFSACNNGTNSNVPQNSTSEINNVNPDIYKIYQLYQAQGGDLSYDEWLKSIKGDKGDQGEPGQDGHSPVISIGEDGYWYIDDVNTNVKAQGEQGLQGIQGEKGDTGAQGPQGSQGPKGDQGEKGDTGAQGPQGIQGEKGDQGDTGATGPQGSQGIQGETGPQGSQGPKGDQGETGPQGPKGDTGVSIVSTTIDENGDLIITYSDGTIKNAGHLKDINTYTVNFYCDDDLVATRQVLDGQKVARPTAQETAGYTVNYWYTKDGDYREQWNFQGCVITENTNIYADFTYNQYTISFVDERFHNTVADLNVVYDASYSLPVLSQTGYTHSGWMDSSGNIYDDSKPYRTASNIKLYAAWDANKYAVELDANGGTVSSNLVSATFDEVYSLPTPTRLNYIFLGWFDGETRVSSSATWKYLENKSFTAHWTNVTNTYVFDAGDGTCDVETMVIGWEDDYSLPTPTCPDGFEFDGWYLGDTYIPQTGTWNYANTGATLVARYYDANLSITDNGAISAINKTASEYLIPETFHGLPTSEISSEAFLNCSSIKSLKIPAGISLIGDDAFLNCSSLETIVVDKNNPNFVFIDGVLYDKNVTDLICCPAKKNGIINVPDSVSSIRKNAFNGCSLLTSITIPDNVDSIGFNAFGGCSSLVSLTIPFVGGSSTDNCFLSYIFGGKQWDNYQNVPPSLTNVTIGRKCDLIDLCAFYKCSSLTSITIPDSVISIREAAFSGCSSLTSITIPTSVSYISKDAFSGCDSLTSVHLNIGDDGLNLANSAFNNCSSLTDFYIKVPNNINCIPAGGLYRAHIFDNVSVHLIDENDNEITEIIIHDTAPVIGEAAFINCSSLTSITIPTSVTSIENAAFSGCSSLTSLTFVGTMAQWNSIDKTSNWKYNASFNTVHCIDGDVLI